SPAVSLSNTAASVGAGKLAQRGQSRQASAAVGHPSTHASEPQQSRQGLSGTTSAQVLSSGIATLAAARPVPASDSASPRRGDLSSAPTRAPKSLESPKCATRTERMEVSANSEISDAGDGAESSSRRRVSHGLM